MSRTALMRSTALGSDSPEYGHRPPRGEDGKGFRSFVFTADAATGLVPANDVQATYDHLRSIGVQIGPRQIMQMMAAMDANPQPLVTTASITTPIQFLQNWLPGFVNVITAARKIDDLVGMTTSGAWEDEEIVQGVREYLAKGQPYTDYSNIPLSSYNLNWERRTVVRQEMGMRSGVLDAARSSRANVNDAESKREGVAEQLEIIRNRIGFYGFNDGLGRTYGFLNDPNLPAATQFPIGASGSRSWNSKTFDEITSDIRLMASGLRVQSQDNIDPYKTPTTLALPMNQVDALSTPNSIGGMSVRQWMNQTYPAMREENAPELDGAVGDVDVAYLYAETIRDGSTDDGRVFKQIVPAKFRLIGVQQMAKGYEEDSSMATAGIFLTRPWAVSRWLFG